MTATAKNILAQGTFTFLRSIGTPDEYAIELCLIVATRAAQTN